MKTPEQYRLKNCDQYSSRTGDGFGAFQIPAHRNNPGRRTLNIIAADGMETGWDHVSVSVDNAPKQTPTWAEMCLVKSLFWDPSECVVQFHPPESDYVNVHPGVLHLWRSIQAQFPMPPKICV